MAGTVHLPVTHLLGRARHPGPIVCASWEVLVVRETQHQPHCVCSCQLALRAAGLAGERPPRGAPCAVAGGVRGLALVLPQLPALWAGRQGPLPLLWVRACGRGGPAPSLWLACPAGGSVPRGWWEAVPGGVAFHRCEGRLASGAVPLPAARIRGRAAGTHCPCVPNTGCVGMGDPAPAHQRLLLRAGVRRCGGGRRASPGGCLAPLSGAPEVRHSSSPGCPASGRAVGSATHLLWPQACGHGGLALSLWLACPAGGCEPRGWWEAVMGGVAFIGCEGRLLSGAVPLPAARLWKRAARACCPCVPGTAGLGMGDPAPAPQRALARWRCALWGWWEGVPGEGCLVPMSGASQVGRSSSPGCLSSGRAVGVRHPLAVGVGMRACGPSTVPFACMPCGGLRAAGVGGGVPVGWPSTVVRGVWCQALSVSRLPVPGGGQPGPVAHVSRARVVRVWGTQHRPHSAHSCELALRAVGVAGGRPQGVALRRCEGGLKSGTRPPPGCPASERAVGVRYPLAVGAGVRAWRPGTVPLAGMPCGGLRAAGMVGGCSGRGWPSTVVRGVSCQALSLPRPPVPWGGQPGFPRPVFPGRGWCGRGDPAAAPQRALLRAIIARCGGGGGRPRGGALPRCEGCLSSSALPRPAARSQGWLFGSATHVLWARVCGRGGPALYLWLACPAGLCVPRGRWEAVRGGGWPWTVVRSAWCQALSLPRPPVPWGGQPGFRDPCLPGAVVLGVGTQHRPHSVRSCQLSLLAVGVAGGRPRGGGAPL